MGKQALNILIFHMLNVIISQGQISKDFISMKKLPSSAVVFNEPAENLEKCIYLCVGSVACNALVYEPVGSICTGHVDTVTNGDVPSNGTIAMEVIGE